MASSTGNSHSRQAGLIFRHLLDSPEFVEFARILKQLTGLSMALNTPDVGTTGAGVPGDTGNPMCALIRDTVEGARRCEACDRHQHASAGSDGQAKLYTCHAGLYDMAIPLMIQSEHVATISSGQVLPTRPSDAGFARLRDRLCRLNIPEGRLRRAYDKAPWMPRTRLRHVMRLLEIFARQLCASAWRIRELEASLEHPAIRKARTLIDTQFRDAHLQLADAATAAGLAVAHFSHLFHRETGVTFTRYVQALRIEEAKRLLVDTDGSITEICFACGFNSLTHFNRVFHSGEGCSPRQFRRCKQ
ncbi:MAG: PocR ligand-binding domain-containing protein [Armatimonadota bacterium]